MSLYLLILPLYQPSTFIKLTVIYIEQEELNGMKITRCHHYGDFMNLAEFHMDHIGIIGEPNKKFSGEKTMIYG